MTRWQGIGKTQLMEPLRGGMQPEDFQAQNAAQQTDIVASLSDPAGEAKVLSGLSGE
jgi:hypothetical protein